MDSSNSECEFVSCLEANDKLTSAEWKNMLACYNEEACMEQGENSDSGSGDKMEEGACATASSVCRK